MLKTFLVASTLLSLIGLGFFGLSYMRRMGVFIGALEQRHRSIHKSLGSPSVSINKLSLGSAFAINKFLFTRDYLDLGDSELVVLGDSARWRLIAYLMLVAYILLVSSIGAAFVE